MIAVQQPKHPNPLLFAVVLAAFAFFTGLNLAHAEEAPVKPANDCVQSTGYRGQTVFICSNVETVLSRVDDNLYVDLPSNTFFHTENCTSDVDQALIDMPQSMGWLWFSDQTCKVDWILYTKGENAPRVVTP